MLKRWYIFREHFLDVIREVDILDLDTASHKISFITMRIFFELTRMVGSRPYEGIPASFWRKDGETNL